MRVRDEFSRYANSYGECNRIQVEVAQKLLAMTTDYPRRIVDLGCGSGTLYRLIDWEVDHFVGIDFSSGMLALHPVSDEVELRLADFNDPLVLAELQKRVYDRIYSASALQWAEDLEVIFQTLGGIKTPLSLAIFTSGTFKTLHEVAHIPPLLRSGEEIIAMAKKYMNAQYELFETILPFESVLEMFRYIKRSGVSGGRNVLSFTQTKALMKHYPLTYLEFEIVFIST